MPLPISSIDSLQPCSTMRRATSGTGVPEPCQARSSSQYPPWSAAIFSSPSCQYGSESINVPSMSQNTASKLPGRRSGYRCSARSLRFLAIVTLRSPIATFFVSYDHFSRAARRKRFSAQKKRDGSIKPVRQSVHTNRLAPIGSRKPTHAQANSRKPTQQPTHSNGGTWKSPKCLRNEKHIRRNRSAAIAAIRHRPLLDESQDLRATTPESPAPERPSRHSPPSSGQCNARRACSR